MSTKKSCYDQIRENISPDGTLNGSFHLDDGKKEGELRFVGGCLDNIMTHHAANSDDADMKPLYNAVTDFCRGNTGADSSMKAIEDYFEKKTALSVIDAFEKWVVEEFDKNRISEYVELARMLLTRSANFEAVKLGLGMIEILSNTETEFKDIVMTLALADEFTRMAAFVISRWKDGGELIFELCKKVDGWGRINLVEEFLTPDTDEKLEWLITDGCRNDVLPDYTALCCVEKTGLDRIVKERPLNDKELDGTGVIIDGLLSEGPCAGISAMENRDEFLGDMLRQYSDRLTNSARVLTVHEILDYYKNREDTNEKNLSEAQRLFSSQQARDTVTASLSDPEQIYAAFSCGRLLGIDGLEKKAMEYLKANISGYAGLIGYAESEDTIGEILKYAEDYPKQIAGSFSEAGVSCAMSILPLLKKYPSHYEEFKGILHRSLRCSFHMAVNSALWALDAYHELTPDADMGEYKEELSAILGSENTPDKQKELCEKLLATQK